MSAFIINQATMDIAVTAIVDATRCPFTTTFANTLRRLIDADDIGRRLYDLNGRAVRGRYPTNPEMHDAGMNSAANYRWQPAFAAAGTSDLTKLCRYLRALHCLSYQCNEDRTTDDPLLAELHRFESALEAAIVQELPEYKAQPWEFPAAA